MLMERKDVSIVTAILPQTRAQRILDKIFEQFGLDCLLFDARGTLKHDHWYEAFIPVINPEYEYMQFIVRDCYVNQFLNYLTTQAKLKTSGSGAVFVTPCSDFSTTSERFSTEITQKKINESTNLQSNNLSAIFALVQSGRTDAAIRAAMQAGSHGPIVYYAEGRGIRDKIAWLKITKKPYEEVILVIVNDVDKEGIVNAIVNAGRINSPGGGILLDLPLSYGFSSLSTSISNSKTLASSHQIVAAIDQLMGNSDWRDTSLLTDKANKKLTHNKKDQEGESDTLLNLICPRKSVDFFVDKAIEYGASGANITYAKHFAGKSDIDPSGFSIHHEVGCIKIVSPTDLANELYNKFIQFCKNTEKVNLSVYKQKLNQRIRYQKR